MDSSFVAELAAAWWRDFIAVATAHPGLSTVALIVALVALLLSRSIFVFVAAMFLCVAAVFGSEPVADPLKRSVFSVGCLGAVLIVSMVAMSLRLTLRELRNELKAVRERAAARSSAGEAETR